MAGGWFLEAAGPLSPCATEPAPWIGCDLSPLGDWMMKQIPRVSVIHCSCSFPGLVRGQPFPSSLTLFPPCREPGSGRCGRCHTEVLEAFVFRMLSTATAGALGPVAPKAQDETAGARCSPCQGRSRHGGWGGVLGQKPPNTVAFRLRGSRRRGSSSRRFWQNP